VSETENYNHQISENLALEALGQLSDLVTACEAVALELEGIRNALESDSAPVQTEEPVAVHTPVATPRGTMTSPEWESWVGGSR